MTTELGEWLSSHGASILLTHQGRAGGVAHIERRPLSLHLRGACRAVMVAEGVGHKRTASPSP